MVNFPDDTSSINIKINYQFASLQAGVGIAVEAAVGTTTKEGEDTAVALQP